MATRTIVVHDYCTTPGCKRLLHSITEGQRGTCGSCWLKTMPQDTEKALNRLIASAFNGSTEEEKGKAVDDAFAKLRRDEKK